jgi:hypothetical protein
MTETRFRFCALALLASILLCQLVQLVRTPFVLGDVRVTNGTLDVNVENHTLDVNVENATLDVRVENTVDVEVTSAVEVKTGRWPLEVETGQWPLEVEVKNTEPIDVKLKR